MELSEGSACDRIRAEGQQGHSFHHGVGIGVTGGPGAVMQACPTLSAPGRALEDVMALSGSDEAK